MPLSGLNWSPCNKTLSSRTDKYNKSTAKVKISEKLFLGKNKISPLLKTPEKVFHFIKVEKKCLVKKCTIGELCQKGRPRSLQFCLTATNCQMPFKELCHQSNAAASTAVAFYKWKKITDGF